MLYYRLLIVFLGIISCKGLFSGASIKVLDAFCTELHVENCSDARSCYNTILKYQKDKNNAFRTVVLYSPCETFEKEEQPEIYVHRQQKLYTINQALVMSMDHTCRPIHMDICMDINSCYDLICNFQKSQEVSHVSVTLIETAVCWKN